MLVKIKKGLTFIGVMVVCLMVFTLISKMVSAVESKDLITHQTDWEKCRPHGNEVVVARVITGQMHCEFHEHVGYGQQSNVLPHHIQLDSPI